MNASSPAVAVVVMSIGPRPTLVAAVRSLVEQDEKLEVVVVHSGPGDPIHELHAAGLAVHGVDGASSCVRVVSSPTTLMPGGARNLGVRSTTAPIVAFLADDCTAGDGWARTRRIAHEEGHRAVASALLCHRPHHPVALAAHLSLFVNRMPLTRRDNVLLYGVSYTRNLFDEHGPFREDVRGGEDTDFNARIGGAAQIAWRPDIQTIHRGTDRLSDFLSDQVGRGRRMVRSRTALGDGMAGAVKTDALVRIGRTLKRSLHVVERRDLFVLILAAPVMVAGGFAYFIGAATHGRDR